MSQATLVKFNERIDYIDEQDSANCDEEDKLQDDEKQQPHSSEYDASIAATEEDLSVTLLERRKRLHELANEINQWENEQSRK
jgi:hypothetical protein